MKRTFFLRRLSSTDGGMRRILKRPIPMDKYYRQAVQCGVYLGDEELVPDDEKLKNNPRTMREQVFEARYKKQQFPLEYELLRLNPPISSPPKMPKKYLRQQEHQRKQHESRELSLRKRLMQDYLNKTSSPYSYAADKQSSDEYYRKLLGIPPPTSSMAMGQKSSILNKAYVVAVKQEELLRRNNDMTEDESLELVEELLKQSQEEESESSRKVQKNVQKWKQEQKRKEETLMAMKINTTEENKREKGAALPPSFDEDDTQDDDSDWDSIPSILHSKPRTIQGIAIWSRKLQAVPYQEWTIGAATALDHFIARSILDVSEATWDAILEGTDPSLKSIGHDIVMVRRTLFPETNIGQEQQEEIDYDAASVEDFEEDDEEEGEDEDSIEWLLASLGGLEGEGGESSAKEMMRKKKDRDKDLPMLMNSLRTELQSWRHRHWEEEDFKEWSPKIQKEFQRFLETYVEIFMPEEIRPDAQLYKEARTALLSVPPMTEDESNTFWDSIRDETAARQFLLELQKEEEKGEREETTALYKKYKTFSTVLSFDEQVSKLVHLSSLRPIYDEYDKDQPQTRLSFLERHADKLLNGTELEHFVKVEDASRKNLGAVTGQDLIDWGYAVNSMSATKNKDDDNDDDDLMIVKPEDRFDVVKLPYNKEEQKERDLMMVAWNIHKASRARYEEFLFKNRRLGLRYGEDDATKE